MLSGSPGMLIGNTKTVSISAIILTMEALNGKVIVQVIGEWDLLTTSDVRGKAMTSNKNGTVMILISLQ